MQNGSAGMDERPRQDQPRRDQLWAARLARRQVLALGGGLAAGAGALPARAEIRGNVVFGQEGWLFAAWEDIRRVNLTRTRQVAALLGQAVGVLKSAGMEVALTIAPTRARIYPEFLPPDFQPGADVARRYAVVMEELGKSTNIIPDLATLFAALRQRGGENVFFKADTHWTAVTAEAAAAELANTIKARVQLPASPRSGARLGAWQSNVHGGDLLQLLTAADRAAHPPERFRIRQSAAASGGGSSAGGLLEDDTADVLIVGNSYMQPYFGFPYALSSQLNRPVGLIWKTARIGPYQTLLDYLGGPQFRAQKPKLLVWHLMEGSMEQMPDAANWWEPTAAMPTARFLSELRRLVGR
jgi:alginate O-acetyltransferase complex protein AlgJ